MRRRRATTGSDLQTIPGVGPRMAGDLMDLGCRCVRDLRGANPDAMYRNLCRLHGRTVDRCVLYVFRCAIYFADHSVHDPDLLKWWNWKDAGGVCPNTGNDGPGFAPSSQELAHAPAAVAHLVFRLTRCRAFWRLPATGVVGEKHGRGRRRRFP